MAELVIAGPGDLRAATGGYRYDARVLADLRARSHDATWLALPEDFPEPSPASLAEAFRLLAGVPATATLVVDGLAYGALPPEEIAALRRPVVALVHHPLALEPGLKEEVAVRLEGTERLALGLASLVIVTSETTRSLLAETYDVPPSKIRVAEPGVDPARPGRGGGGTPVILTVGAITPRKNHVTLARALATLTDLAWRWRIVGSPARDPAYAAALDDEIAAAGIADRVEKLGEVDDLGLEQAFETADLFALPSRLEGYGMAYAEAMARGLPVVAGAGAATAALVTEKAGALVDPDDISGLAAALRGLLDNPAALQRAGRAASLRAARLPRWFQCADVFEHLITRPQPR